MLPTLLPLLGEVIVFLTLLFRSGKARMGFYFFEVTTCHLLKRNENIKLLSIKEKNAAEEIDIRKNKFLSFIDVEISRRI